MCKSVREGVEQGMGFGVLAKACSAKLEVDVMLCKDARDPKCREESGIGHEVDAAQCCAREYAEEGEG